ncbi:hypothetical protein BCR34DRAFT_599130 [Clohesyomyces aquaticus]|uniref:GCN5-related N-acetyltransferase Rv2170-like domain-containing protein n=1 Tax=Clohesyomyces aquaticus TaxID=1231657 RepID=A0A1Y1ZWG8_9PLEO|nr:hypothetical protein BCR34DRAFT_599130 [Clohesyomyces aquaticus]
MPPTVYPHDLPSPLFQHALKRTLPYSINLVYRTQHTNRTPHAHILATFPPSPSPSTQIPRCWAAAYYDRSMRPETELWVFASGEIPGHYSGKGENDQFCPTCKSAVLSLITYMSTLPVPPFDPENLASLGMARAHEKEHPETGPRVRYPPSPGSYVRHLLIPSVVTLGACHYQIVDLLFEAGFLREEFPGRESRLNKFLFRVTDLPQTKELPEGLRWGEMRREDIAIVQARTPIPRSTRTLMSLRSVGVFEESTGNPVAWSFFGLDGSLTTLHVEPQYRGRGIAKSVAAKIFRAYAPGLAEDDEGTAWAHADVYEGNDQSEAVCRSLGGRASWRMFWVRIDVARAKSLSENS